MKCRCCVGCFRRIGFMKAALIVFVTVILFCFSVQLHQLPLSSAKVISRMASRSETVAGINHVVKQVLPARNNNISQNEKHGKGVDSDPSRVIGKGRSPKQVNEDIKSRPISEENQATTLNHTVKVAHMDPLPSLSGPSSLEMLQQALLKANKAQTVRNQDKFPPLGEDGLVVVVQVHKREGYLKQLLESLKVARGIEKVLLVISHDYYYDDMNKLIHSIDFCPVSKNS